MTISLIWGAPSQGKTYYATLQAILALLAGKRVFTNYPVIYLEPLRFYQKIINLFLWLIYVIKLAYWGLLSSFDNWNKPKYIRRYTEKEYSSLKWEEEYLNINLNNCVIILDEAYRYFNSHKRSVEDETHLFFATNGHAGIDIFLIAQHYNRINLIIKEMASYYIYIEKINNPISIVGSGKRNNELTPLFFNAMSYISEEDFKRRWVKETIWRKERIWFNANVANAYNTTFFKSIEKKIRPIKWSNILKEKKQCHYCSNNCQVDWKETQTLQRFFSQTTSSCIAAR